MCTFDADLRHPGVPSRRGSKPRMNGDRSGAKSHLREACNTDHASRSTLFTLLDVCSFDSSIAGYSSSFSYWIGLPPALSLTRSLRSLASFTATDPLLSHSESQQNMS